MLLPSDSKAQSNLAKTADSLFNAKNYTEAAVIYEGIFENPDVNHKNISLKLAYIYENEANYPRTLYYLNNYYNISPSNEVFDKMYKIALVNKYNGYGRDNINFFISIYQQYYIYILYGLILLGIGLLVVLLRRKIKYKTLLKGNRTLVIIYLLGLGLIINTPKLYKPAIVKNTTYLRTHPTSAAPVISKIEPGNKINIIGKGEVWLKAFVDNEIVFVNGDDLWILKF